MKFNFYKFSMQMFITTVMRKQLSTTDATPNMLWLPTFNFCLSQLWFYIWADNCIMSIIDANIMWLAKFHFHNCLIAYHHWDVMYVGTTEYHRLPTHTSHFAYIHTYVMLKVTETNNITTARSMRQLSVTDYQHTYLYQYVHNDNSRWGQWYN